MNAAKSPLGGVSVTNRAVYNLIVASRRLTKQQKFEKQITLRGDLDEIPSRRSEPAIEPLDRKALRGTLTKWIMRHLRWQHRSILFDRYGLGTSGVPITLEVLGRVWKVSKERVRQIEAKALRICQNAEFMRQLAECFWSDGDLRLHLRRLAEEWQERIEAAEEQRRKWKAMKARWSREDLREREEHEASRKKKVRSPYRPGGEWDWWSNPYEKE